MKRLICLAATLFIFPIVFSMPLNGKSDSKPVIHSVIVPPVRGCQDGLKRAAGKCREVLHIPDEVFSAPLNEGSEPIPFVPTSVISPPVRGCPDGYKRVGEKCREVLDIPDEVPPDSN